ncbi:MAG: DUF3050 domain-containing protein [Planctomycetes bacterium]|nr:DUF3050 domain-containing protein [Planctomycetota bacterium]
MARQMVTTLCGTDQKRWREAEESARVALRARIDLWNGGTVRQSGKYPTNRNRNPATHDPVHRCAYRKRHSGWGRDGWWGQTGRTGPTCREVSCNFHERIVRRLR